MALDNNRQLKIAVLDVERAQERVAEARTKRLPAFSTYVPCGFRDVFRRRGMTFAFLAMPENYAKTAHAG